LLCEVIEPDQNFPARVLRLAMFTIKSGLLMRMLS
jgi:hypothetical protein